MKPPRALPPGLGLVIHIWAGHRQADFSETGAEPDPDPPLPMVIDLTGRVPDAEIIGVTVPRNVT